jgi:hypothetical protein
LKVIIDTATITVIKSLNVTRNNTMKEATTVATIEDPTTTIMDTTNTATTVEIIMQTSVKKQ